MMFDSADIYRNLGVIPVINAQSWVTKLGGSRMRPEVLDSMNKASQLFVDVEDLHHKCSQEIAHMCNADAALITSGCASAIVLMSAAAICKRDESLIEKIPNLNFRPEILIHKGQRNHYDSLFEMTGAKIIDLLATPNGVEVFESTRIDTPHTHGTGCTLASAIAISIAQGMPVRSAVIRARKYVYDAIGSAPGYGGGHGPINHGHPVPENLAYEA